MAKSAPTKNVELLIRSSVYVAVSAKTLEDALEAGRALKISDVIDYKGNEVLDHNIMVVAVSDPNVNDKLYD